ncbi:hypothetical protein GBAR_LOCUS37 [Geodia barretti]|uniref:Apolipoprotein L3 n=1 Tax=Geodia barretti TaxID=519541 RepID=A0AA35QR65_GEOBA|nr:hypothetical protein GBAR_LOCUS37 [Geodia barretti]
MPHSQPPISVSRQKLDGILPESYADYTKLVAEFEKLMEYRAETISAMNSVADELDRRHRDTNIAKIVGSSVGVLGAVAGAVGGVGLALVPFTAGLSATVAAVAGGSLQLREALRWVWGLSLRLERKFVEKLLENVDLAKVQKVVDKDKAQCDKVQGLWDRFEKYSSDIVQTIELADLSEEPDLESLKTWVLVATRETKSKVSVVAEAFHAAYKEITKGKTSTNQPTDINAGIGTPTADDLMGILVSTAKAMAGKVWQMRSVVSHIAASTHVVGCAVAFTLIATIGVGNLFVLITTSINVHNGSLSKVAEEIRGKSSRLIKEYKKFREAFTDLKRD